MFNNKFSTGILKHPGYNIGGGLGEAALYGALFGGAKAAVTGEDVLKGALVGGVTGSAVNGIGDVFANGANNLSAIKTGDFVDAAGNSFDPLPANTVPDITPPAAVTNTAQEAENMGIANPNAPNMNQVTKVGGYTAGQPIQGEAGTALGTTPAQWEGETAAQQGNAVAGLGATPQAATGNPYAKLRDMVSAPEGSTTAKGLNWAAENPALTSLGGGAAYGALTQKPPTVAQLQQEKSKLAGYNPNNFASYSPVSNVYSPSYAAEGGVMQSYAQGGIADLASGGQMAPQQANIDFMGGDMYPQSQQQRSFYATPTQMPTSAQQAMASYEPNTNPLTGQPTVGMAQGGVTGYAAGGTPDTGGQVYYDSASGKYYTQTNPGGFMNMGPDSIFSTIFGGFANDPAMNSNDPTSPFWNGRTYLGGSPTGAGEFQASQVTPEVYQQPTYASQPTTTAVSSTIPSYSLADSLPLLQATNPGIAAMYAPKTEEVVKKAEGGIAGYNLGGYAAGGNPRLLKGPGDGMSDNIPATIGGKQPARLADSEFVVPADVVSHLGNGSTDAGAKHLYNMMDRVRKARTGKTKQAPAIKPEKFLPA